jgi:glutamate/tyrosine decarboxylase-like PLP-dependent enzyme
MVRSTTTGEPGGDVHAAAMAVSNLFFNDQWLGKYNQPSFNRLLAEIEGMVLDILDAPDGAHCCLTTGGTASIILAMKTARDWAAAERPTAGSPEILLPFSAHPAFNKAAAFLGLKVVRVPQGPDWRADIAAMGRAIRPDTIAIVGSAPSWPHGLIDPIPAIAALAREHGLWCHVDACIGGFLLPFYRAAGAPSPPWELAIEGRSISADLHKFGYTPNGMSSLTLKRGEDRRFLQFSFMAGLRNLYDGMPGWHRPAQRRGRGLGHHAPFGAPAMSNWRGVRCPPRNGWSTARRYRPSAATGAAGGYPAGDRACD